MPKRRGMREGSGKNPTWIFDTLFTSLTALTTIPENLFYGFFATKPTANNNLSFYSTFGGCTSLDTIPPNLFLECVGPMQANMF